MRRRFALVVFAALIACGSPRSSAVASAPLGADDVARVGSDEIPASVVLRVATERGIVPRAALDAVVEDALAAQGARARGLDQRPDVGWGLVAVRARMLAEHAKVDARAAGPPTDAEVRALTAAHWRDVDRPESVRVVHVVVRRPKNDARDQVARAKDLAARLAKAVAGATSADDFIAKANAVDHGDLEVVAQPLPPFTADGRVTDPGHAESMDATFASAAFALGAPPATSAVVETSFGWHVIRVLERLPEKRVPLETRRTMFTAEVDATRAREAVDAARDRRAKIADIAVSSAADALMSEGAARLR